MVTAVKRNNYTDPAWEEPSHSLAKLKIDQRGRKRYLVAVYPQLHNVDSGLFRLLFLPFSFSRIFSLSLPLLEHKCSMSLYIECPGWQLLCVLNFTMFQQLARLLLLNKTHKSISK